MNAICREETKMERKIINNIKWLGHDGFLIKTKNNVICIDPYEIGDAGKADIILITHSHFDHCSIPDISKIRKSSTVFVTDKESAASIEGDVRVVKPGDSISVSGIEIDVVPAYNINKTFHPREKNWLGFVINIENEKIYHAGDTDLIPEMGSFPVDIALLPVSGTYVMTAEEAVEAAKRIKPKTAIPMHYNSIVGSLNDALKFKKALEEFCEVVILERKPETL
jgi:L-ascorbate metabolism protein UlaG (beta-lactamase superfamily)